MHKFLYGYKQSHWAWFRRFSEVLQQFGMIRFKEDVPFLLNVCHQINISTSWFMWWHSDGYEGIEPFKDHLFHNFQTNDLGPLRYFHGIEVAQSKFGNPISERKYALDIFGDKPCRLQTNQRFSGS